MRSLATVLTEAGHIVEIVCSDRAYSDCIELPLVEIRKEARVNRYRSVKGLFGYAIQLLAASRLIWKRNHMLHGFDKIVARSHHAVIFCYLAGLRNIIYIAPAIYAHQCIHRRRWAKPRELASYLVNVTIQSLAFHLSSETVVLSEAMQSQVQVFSRDAVTPRLVFPGIDCKRFYPRDPMEKISICRELELPEQVKLVLGVGRFTSVKGFEHAISAMKCLSENFHLVLVGEGPLNTSYREQARQQGVLDRLHIKSATLTPETYYKAADAFVFPSVYEPFGQVLLEATASGLPIIAFSKKAGVETATEKIYQGFKELVLFSDVCSGRGLATAIEHTRWNSIMTNKDFQQEWRKFIARYSCPRVVFDLFESRT